MKKTKSSQQPQDETILYKIGGVVGDIAGKLSNQKDHLIQLAGNAIASVKNAVHDLAEKKQPMVEKGINVPIKKTATKIARPPKAAPDKKAAPVKKTPTAKKNPKPLAAAPAKKSAPIKTSSPIKKAPAAGKIVKSAKSPVSKVTPKATK